MDVPRRLQRFTRDAAAVRGVASMYGAKVSGYMPAGEALDLAAERIAAHPAHEGGLKTALTAAARLAMLHSSAMERGPRESYYGRGQAKRDYDLIRHK